MYESYEKSEYKRSLYMNWQRAYVSVCMRAATKNKSNEIYFTCVHVCECVHANVKWDERNKVEVKKLLY